MASSSGTGCPEPSPGRRPRYASGDEDATASESDTPGEEADEVDGSPT